MFLHFHGRISACLFLFFRRIQEHTTRTLNFFFFLFGAWFGFSYLGSLSTVYDLYSAFFLFCRGFSKISVTKFKDKNF